MLLPINTSFNSLLAITFRKYRLLTTRKERSLVTMIPKAQPMADVCQTPCYFKILQCRSGSKEKKTICKTPIPFVKPPSLKVMILGGRRDEVRGALELDSRRREWESEPPRGLLLTWQRSATYALLLAPFSPSHRSWTSVRPTLGQIMNEWRCTLSWGKVVNERNKLYNKINK